MHRTNVVLDTSVLGKAKILTGIKTTKDIIHYALKELVRHKRQKELLKLKGSVDWKGDLNSSRLGRTN